MARKSSWWICSECLEKFIDGCEKDHKVNTDAGQQCMGQAQLLKTFKRDAERKAWSKR